MVYPVDTIKTLLATNQIPASKGIFSNLISIRKQFGILRLYKGLSATCFGIFPYAGLKFFFFNFYKDIISRKNDEQSIFKTNSIALTNLISGALAGCSAVSITYPTDLIRRRKQFSNGNNGKHLGYVDILKDIFRKEGLRGFYNGLKCTYYKIIPSTAFVFMINGYLNGSNKSK